MKPSERVRMLLRASFFALFVLAPPLDLLRFDLTQGHALFFGQPWLIGIDDFLDGSIGAGELAVRVLVRVFLPLLAAALLLGIAFRWGRIYCGWLCPHFSVVELLNGLMRRTIGKHSLWDRQPLSLRRRDGTRLRPSAAWWPLTLGAALAFAFLWAVVLLTYLLPPAEVYANLFTGRLTPNQARFIGIATALFFLDFMLARHLFCRFGCAVGLFQSLAWMANRRAMVVGFDRRRARACQTCDNACDQACPMRLHPRTLKRHMFSCTQCGQCIRACETVQGPRPSLLRWVSGACALGKGEGAAAQAAPGDCFSREKTAALPLGG